MPVQSHIVLTLIQYLTKYSKSNSCRKSTSNSPDHVTFGGLCMPTMTSLPSNDTLNSGAYKRSAQNITIQNIKDGTKIAYSKFI